jgi:hypothetical protein
MDGTRWDRGGEGMKAPGLFCCLFVCLFLPGSSFLAECTKRLDDWMIPLHKKAGDDLYIMLATDAKPSHEQTNGQRDSQRINDGLNPHGLGAGWTIVTLESGEELGAGTGRKALAWGGFFFFFSLFGISFEFNACLISHVISGELSPI